MGYPSLFSMLLLKSFSAFALLLSFISCCVPQDNLPDKPTFDQYFKHLAGLLQDPKSRAIEGCPYTTAKIVLTLYRCYAKPSFYKELYWFSPRILVNYKYKPIVDEMRKAFDASVSDLKTTHISAMEAIINRALSVIIENQNAMVHQMLDEALIKKNPLKIFRFPKNEPLLVYGPEDVNDSLFSVAFQYEKLIQKLVFKQLTIISRESLSKAGIIDLLILIRQHFHSMTYFSVDIDGSLLKILRTVSKFPELSLAAFSNFIREGRDLESNESFLKFLNERIRAIEPFELASFRVDLDAKSPIFNSLKSLVESFFNSNVSAPPIVSLLYTFLDNPDTADKYRFYFTGFMKLPLFLEPYLNSSPPDKFHDLFAYDLCFKVDRIFPGIVLRLTGRGVSHLR